MELYLHATLCLCGVVQSTSVTLPCTLHLILLHFVTTEVPWLFCRTILILIFYQFYLLFFYKHFLFQLGFYFSINLPYWLWNLCKITFDLNFFIIAHASCYQEIFSNPEVLIFRDIWHCTYFYTVSWRFEIYTLHTQHIILKGKWKFRQHQPQGWNLCCDFLGYESVWFYWWFIVFQRNFLTSSSD